jgi:hypothetical protein
MRKIELKFIDPTSFVTITYIDEDDNKFTFYAEEKNKLEPNGIIYKGKKYSSVPDFLNDKINDVENYIILYINSLKSLKI